MKEKGILLLFASTYLKFNQKEVQYCYKFRFSCYKKLLVVVIRPGILSLVMYNHDHQSIYEELISEDATVVQVSRV